jgi:hypothetical protein
MGHDIHITRKKNWSDESQNAITLDEWKACVRNDSEMKLDNFAEIITQKADFIRFDSEGIAVWTKHSSVENVFISWRNGKVSVSKPDDEIIKKMIRIAEKLKAKVQSDEGEIYSLDENGNIVSV